MACWIASNNSVKVRLRLSRVQWLISRYWQKCHPMTLKRTGKYPGDRNTPSGPQSRIIFRTMGLETTCRQVAQILSGLKSSQATLSSKNISFASILPLLQSVIVGPSQSRSLTSYFTGLSSLHNAAYFLRLVPRRMVQLQKIAQFKCLTAFSVNFSTKSPQSGRIFRFEFGFSVWSAHNLGGFSTVWVAN